MAQIVCLRDDPLDQLLDRTGQLRARCRPGADLERGQATDHVTELVPSGDEVAGGGVSHRARVAGIGDIWADMLRRGRSLKRAIQKLEKMRPAFTRSRNAP